MMNIAMQGIHNYGVHKTYCLFHRPLVKAKVNELFLIQSHSLDEIPQERIEIETNRERPEVL